MNFIYLLRGSRLPVQQIRKPTITREHFRLSLVALETVEISKQKKSENAFLYQENAVSYYVNNDAKIMKNVQLTINDGNTFLRKHYCERCGASPYCSIALSLRRRNGIR